MTDHYLLQGKEIIPCDLMTWAHWLENDEHTMDRLIGRWEFKSCDVSTVFLGLDHSHRRSGPPILFETMIFGGPLDGDCERYATYEEAETGHLHWCGKVARYEAVTHWRKLKRWRNKLLSNRRHRLDRLARLGREAKAIAARST